MAYEWLYVDPPPAFLPTINKFAQDGLTWDGITKLLHFDAYDTTGAPHLLAIDPTTKDHGLIKMASHWPHEMNEAIEKLEHKPDRIHVIGNAMGATEKWSSNRNKDSFPRLGLQNADPDTYGHKTFESAHVFKHHQNSHPKHSIGKVVSAFYDDVMDKVLLLYYILKDKAPHIVDRLEKGDSMECSMGCFLQGTPVTLWDGRRVPIEMVAVGDMVLTAAGTSRPVSELHVREYRGQLIRIKPRAEDPIEATANHQFLVLKREEVVHVYPGGKSNARRHPDEKIDLSRRRWVAAADLQKGDFLLQPVDNEVITPEWADRTIARLLGYYAAEGNLFYSAGEGNEEVPRGIALSTHIDDPVHTEFAQLCADFGTKNPPTKFAHSKSEYGSQLHVSDRRLALLCRDYVGCLAKQKTLASHFMKWDPALQLEFLGAYINGDGWQNGSKWQSGSVGISTGNANLANQLVQMLLRCGIVANINTIGHRAGLGFNYHDTVEYQIYIPKRHAALLSTVSAKIKPVDARAVGGCDRKLHQGYVLVPVDSVEPVLVDYVGPVYNLEIAATQEEEHSYLVRGLSAHNCKTPFDICSICNNKAKTRAEYCEHLKGPELILPNGQKAMAHTPYPKFFDHSHVAKGADPIAKTLAVVDHEAKKAWDSRPQHFIMNHKGDYQSLQKTAAVYEEPRTPGFDLDSEVAKLADIHRQASIIKMVPGMSQAIEKVIKKKAPEVETKIAAYLQALSSVLDFTPTFSPSFLNKLAQNFTPGEIISSLASKGIVLKPQEFFTVIKEASESDLMPQRINVDLRLTQMLSQDTIDARSGFSDSLFKRAAFMSNFLKEAGAPQTQINPQQIMQLLQMLQTMQGQQGSSNSPFQTGQAYMPPNLQRALLQEAMLKAYQTNIGQADPHAFDKPVEWPGSFAKGASCTDFIESCRGVPTQAFFKSAGAPITEELYDTQWLETVVPEHDVWLQEYVSKPMRSLEKVASILEDTPAYLLDAATTMHLRFVRDVFSESISLNRGH